MSRRIATPIVVLTAIAVPAGFSAAAQAAEGTWWIAGSPFKGTAELSETTSVTSNFKLEMHGKGILFTIECEGVKIKGAQIENGTERSDPSDGFEKCFAVGKPTCTVSSTVAKPLKAVIEGSTGAFKLKFAPKTGTEIASWTVSNCGAESGTYLADGTMTCKYPGIETEAVEHPLEFSSTSGSSVTVGGVASAFTLTYSDKLKSGQKWSVQ